jgi:flavodoxin long chain
MGEGNGDMARIGLFYGSTSGKTRKAAELIRQALGEGAVELHDVREATADSLRQYDSLILGVPTWHRGELQDDWEEFAHALEAMNLSSKTVALFGLGDQASYPDAFADALGGEPAGAHRGARAAVGGADPDAVGIGRGQSDLSAKTCARCPSPAAYYGLECGRFSAAGSR